MVRVRNTDERHLVGVPPSGKGTPIFRPDSDDHRITVRKFLIVLSQLRQVLTAVGSEKAAAKHEDDILLALVRREPYRVALGVGRGEIRGLRSHFFVYHSASPYNLFRRRSNFMLSNCSAFNADWK